MNNKALQILRTNKIGDHSNDVLLDGQLLLDKIIIL